MIVSQVAGRKTTYKWIGNFSNCRSGYNCSEYLYPHPKTVQLFKWEPEFVIFKCNAW